MNNKTNTFTEPRAVIGMLSRIREKANCLLELELKKRGIKGILPAHGPILRALFNCESGIRLSDIAARTGRTKSTVTELVNKLEKKGYLKKSPCTEDGRVTYIVATDKARAIETDFREISDRLLSTAYKGFSEDEQVFLVKLLSRMKENFEEVC
ncbi:MAG: MarR family transcriptional regulator [bacterium]|nr:MarR family transcriptional regulator [bacterium]